MNLNIIETVVAVSRSKSFQDAAYALNYTPAVVSKHVARAEAELGVKLFFRGNKANDISMTPECEAIIEELAKIRTGWKRLENTLEHLKNSEAGASVRIGLGQRPWSYYEDEIIADFIQCNPDVTVDLTHGYTMDLLNSMAQGRIDGVFVTTLGRAEALESAADFMRKNDCEFFRVLDNCRMYIAISETHPLAQKTEADFSEFGDYTIAINSDKMTLGSERRILPFQVLSRKYGMELKYTYLPTTDASAYQIAKSTYVAIPVPDNRVKFEGIRYIRLRDWTEPFNFYFVTMNSRESGALKRFKNAVRAYGETYHIEN